MSLTRVLRTSAATLSHTFYVDGVAADASGAVTYAVTRLDGTAVTSGTATRDAVGVYSFVKPGYADLDTHVVTWTATFGGAIVTAIDYVEIVGGFLCTLDRIIEPPDPITDLTKYPMKLIAQRRLEAEVECERLCGRAFVPRFRRVQCNGTGTEYLFIPDMEPRTIRAVTINGEVMAGTDLSAIKAIMGGVLYRFAVWPSGVANVIVEYEFGLDVPPPDLTDAVATRAKIMVKTAQRQTPVNASSYTTPESGVYRIAPPGPRSTGIPDVDRVYQDYALDLGGFA